jgi:hypothetical protein
VVFLGPGANVDMAAYFHVPLNASDSEFLTLTVEYHDNAAFPS